MRSTDQWFSTRVPTLKPSYSRKNLGHFTAYCIWHKLSRVFDEIIVEMFTVCSPITDVRETFSNYRGCHEESFAVKNHNHDTDILLQIFEVRIEVTCPIPNADCSAKFNGVWKLEMISRRWEKQISKVQPPLAETQMRRADWLAADMVEKLSTIIRKVSVKI